MHVQQNKSCQEMQHQPSIAHGVSKAPTRTQQFQKPVFHVLLDTPRLAMAHRTSHAFVSNHLNTNLDLS